MTAERSRRACEQGHAGKLVMAELAEFFINFTEHYFICSLKLIPCYLFHEN